jgi:hypothetical protein
MNQKTKILIGFIAGIVMILGQITVNYLMNVHLIESSRAVYAVEAPLNVLTEQVIGYDAMLTDHVRSSVLAAQLGDKELVEHHQAEYNRIGEMLDNLLKKQARVLIGKSQRSQADKDAIVMLLGKLDVVNQDLVDLEIQAFDALKADDIDNARQLVMDEKYLQYKKELFSYYTNWSEMEGKQTADATRQLQSDADFLVYFNLFYSIASLSVIIVILTYFKSLFVEHSKK